MKFLHLSDLHIGKSVNGFSMLEEQKHAFNQIIGYISDEKPDALVIAGDVYDRAIPGVEAVQVFDDFITALAKTKTAVMLISGNHDSPQRLGFASRLFAERNLHFYGTFDGAMRKVSLNDEFGEVHFWLLPFIKPASVQGMFTEQEIESYDDAISAVLKMAEIDYTARNVLVSHQFYNKAGIELERSESESNPVGGLDAVSAELIEHFDYAALGHLHGGQSVGPKHIRYCGSPVKYSFSEWQQKKSITIVNFAEKGNVTIKTLPFNPLHDMREIKGELNKLISEEISSLAGKEDYLKVVLTDKEEIIDPMGKLRSVYPNIMTLSFEKLRANFDLDTISADIETIEKLTPYDLFSEFFLKVKGSTMSIEQDKIVRELLLEGDS